ncbi:hypothetical protein DENSPDRAFT_440960 [Dentipellis sp. KUC8613]|nr:hypothetical protein DENSPDRAFT_440960 [Dentipellis sp. KUC8613]
MATATAPASHINPSSPPPVWDSASLQRGTPRLGHSYSYSVLGRRRLEQVRIQERGSSEFSSSCCGFGGRWAVLVADVVSVSVSVSSTECGPCGGGVVEVQGRTCRSGASASVSMLSVAAYMRVAHATVALSRNGVAIVRDSSGAGDMRLAGDGRRRRRDLFWSGVIVEDDDGDRRRCMPIGKRSLGWFIVATVAIPVAESRYRASRRASVHSSTSNPADAPPTEKALVEPPKKKKYEEIKNKFKK